MEENATNINETEVTEIEEKKEPTTETTDEELVNQIAQLKEELRKTKKDKDQASSDAAKYKKALRAKQTAEERDAEELAEQKRLADEEKENMRKELNHIKAVAAYKNISDETSVEMMIDAVSEGDHQAIATIMNNEIEKAVKEAIKAEKVKWLKENPPVNAGTGDTPTVTKAQFNKMNYSQKVELFNKNPELYAKLTESEE